MSLPVSEIAAILINAAAARTAIEPLTNTYTDLDAAHAYDIQDTVVRARVDAGAAVLGAKLGLTSAAKQKQMNVAEPLYGFLTDDMLIEPGRAIAVTDYIQPRCEPEIAFVLSRDLAGGHVTGADVLDATALVFPAIDVLDSRFTGYAFTINDVIADNASSAGFTLGGVGVSPIGIDLRLVGCTFYLNEVLISTAAGAAVLGDPSQAVAWMVRKLAARGRGLSAGQIVMAGALTEAIAVSHGDIVSARFDRLGEVTLNVV